MASLTVRITETTHRLLGELARRSGQSMQAVLDRALEEYRRKCFLEGLAADFAALRADPKAWAEEQAERALWDATLMDGLDPDEKWDREGRLIKPKRRRKKR